MSSVMPFIFNNIDGKPWTRAREVSRALEYGEKSKTATIVKHHCSKEDFVQCACSMHTCRLFKRLTKVRHYINEDGMYELLFSSQQPKTKNFRKHCCNVMFPHIWQPLTNKMVDELRHEHQQAIEEHEQVITLLSDNLQGRHSQIEAIQCENVGLQAEIREKG